MILLAVMWYALNLTLQLKDLEVRAYYATGEWRAFHAKSNSLFRFEEPDPDFLDNWVEDKGAIEDILSNLEIAIVHLPLGAEVEEQIGNVRKVWRLTDDQLDSSRELYERIRPTPLGEHLAQTTLVELLDNHLNTEKVDEAITKDMWLFYRLQDAQSDMDVSGEVLSTLLETVEANVRESTSRLVNRVTLASSALSLLLISVTLFIMRAVEQTRINNQENFRVLIESAPDGFLIANRHETIILVNALIETLFGYTRDELIGMNLLGLIPHWGEASVETDSETSDEIPNASIEGKNTLTGTHKDGGEFFLEYTLSHLGTGQNILYLIGVRDVTDRLARETERLRLEDQMQQMQKLESLGILAGGIAHDFNNLLTGISGNAELAMQDLEKGSKLYGRMEKIVRISDISSSLCRELLAYSGKGKFLIKTIELNSFLREITSLITLSISKSSRILYELEDGPHYVDVDVAQFQQVILNLITNASDSIGSELGEIVVSSGSVETDRAILTTFSAAKGLPPGRYEYIEIGDTGCGMSEGEVEKIFDPFYTSKEGGHGLGLSAVLGIVVGHGGAIDVKSVEGVGTTFKVYFPASDQEVLKEEDSGQQNSRIEITGSILVADDEEENRELLTAIFAKIGCDIVLAQDGQHALDTFEQDSDSFELLVLDITMPRLSGIDALKKIRAIRNDIPAVLISGYSEKELIEHEFQGPNTHFVQKPFRIDEFMQALNSVLN